MRKLMSEIGQADRAMLDGALDALVRDAASLNYPYKTRATPWADPSTALRASCVRPSMIVPASDIINIADRISCELDEPSQSLWRSLS